MNNEVAEFLRRAAQRRAALEAQAAAQAAAQARTTMQGQAPRQQVVDAEVIEIVELAAAPSRISAAVNRDMQGAQQIARQTKQLGQRVEQADDEMNVHLQQTFDHQVGTLKQSKADAKASSEVAVVVSAQIGTAHGIARMLRSPENIKAAVLLGEILNRPTDRW